VITARTLPIKWKLNKDKNSMTPRNVVSSGGFFFLIAGTNSPLISPLGLVKWNLFDLNQTFATVLLVIAIAGLVASYLKNIRLIRIAGIITLVLVLLVFIAAVMKVNTSFSFIPFPKLAQTMSGFIHYRWGWYLLFAGPILALLGTNTTKSIHTSGK
jgi:hypothetical protein